MAHIPVVLGLTALVAVPTAVGVHFLSTSGKTQTQETVEQQSEEREVRQPEDVRPSVETQSDDFSSLDVDATDLEEEIEVSPDSSRPQEPSGSQSGKQKDQDFPKLSKSQLALPVVTVDLMEASEMQEGSIGPKFKDKLLSNPKDEAWIEKTNIWAKRLVVEDTKSSLTSIFIPQRPVSDTKPVWSRINVSGLQARCKQAYGRTTWGSLKAGVDRNAYWTTVKELCGKKDAEFPTEWNPAK